MSWKLTRPEHDDVESFHGRFFKMRKALGTTAFGINEIRLPAGAEGIEHDEVETGHDEVYVILGGSGHFTVDTERVDVREGDYLFVPAVATRMVYAGDAGLRFLVVAGKPLGDYDGRPML